MDPWSPGIIGEISKFRIVPKALIFVEISSIEDLEQEDDPISTLGKSFQNLFETGILSDYKIIRKTCKFDCHRNILACRSKFFLNLFQSNCVK